MWKPVQYFNNKNRNNTHILTKIILHFNLLLLCNKILQYPWPRSEKTCIHLFELHSEKQWACGILKIMMLGQIHHLSLTYFYHHWCTLCFWKSKKSSLSRPSTHLKITHSNLLEFVCNPQFICIWFWALSPKANYIHVEKNDFLGIASSLNHSFQHLLKFISPLSAVFHK